MKSKMNLLVVMALAITTILFVKATPLYAAKYETRTTVSVSHIDYWELDSQPGKFISESHGLNKIVEVGERVSYQFQHPYYRGLNPGEKLKEVKVRSGSIGYVSPAEYIDAKYQNQTDKPYDTFDEKEQQYARSSTNVDINGLIQDTIRPIANVKTQPILLSTGPGGDARDISELERPPGNTSIGWRTYTVFILEWTIQLAENADPTVTTQHFNKGTNTALTSVKTYRVSENVLA